MTCSILIVEDTAILAEAMADMLRMEGFRVMLAANGSEALAVMEHERPDLIISDLKMPVMGGIEFSRQVRSSNRLCNIPIIILSAQVGEASKLESVQAGADIFLTKPFDEDELLSSINHLLHELNREN